ncbi:MAG TPA: quinone oxidoreductase [Alphaproteobacteria bacterium]
MPKALVIHQPGGPSCMQWEDVEVGDPGPGAARIKQTALGANFVDIYFRSGLYPHALPFITGMEGAGVVEAVGKGVKNVKPGDRVVYGGELGAYAEARLIPAARLVKIPNGISDVQAAGMFHRGLTAQALIRQAYRAKKGDTILFHAAAGGVGLIICQWAKALGVKVIGTVGSDAKAAIAKKHGCTYPVVYTRENFVAAVHKITKGRGVPVVYDGIGKDTYPGSLECLAPRGLFLVYGNTSGPIPPVDTTLMMKRALYMTRFNVYSYAPTPQVLARMAGELFRMVKSGKIKIEVNQSYALKDAARAHEDMAARKTTGSTVLIP